MSRSWKKPNHSLPGASHYSIPSYGFSQKDWPNQQSQSKPKRKGFRKWKRQKNRAKWLAKKRAKTQHAPEPAPMRVWYLTLQNPEHVSVWRGRGKRLRCCASPAPYEWFLRVVHLGVLEQFILRNHLPYRWHREPPVLKCLSGSESKVSDGAKPRLDGIEPIASSGDI
jgi:hypothetical protein